MVDLGRTRGDPEKEDPGAAAEPAVHEPRGERYGAKAIQRSADWQIGLHRAHPK